MNYVKIRDLSKPQKGFYGIGASAVGYSEDLPQYLRITDIDDFGCAPSILPTCININEYSDWKRYLLKENDIVFARTGNSTGRNYFYKTAIKDTVFAGFLIKFSIDPEKVIPQYVGYYCQSQAYWDSVKALFTGSTRANINAEQYGDLLIPVINRDVQQHIVNTIGSVDDLIEKKHEILIKIEEISNIIFQKAVLNGNNITLSYFISFEKGRQVIFSETGFPYLNIDSLELMPTLFSNDQGIICNENDILMVMDGASSGNVYMGNSGIVGATLAKIKTTLNSFYLYLYFKRNFNLIQSMNTGSAIPHANKKAIGDLIVKYNDTYNEKFEHLFQMWVRLKKEIKTLKIIKDKLIKKYF